MIIENYICSMILIILGLYTIIIKKNLMKIVIGLGLLEYGIYLLIISIGYIPSGNSPIFTPGEIKPETSFVDPILQKMTITSIVIGVCVTAVALSLVVKIKEKYGTIDADKVRGINK